MRLLLTGGAGFIGSHLGDLLLANDHEIVCLDNFNTFYDPEIKKRNIENALSNPGYKLVTGDILDKDLLSRVFEEKFDAVIHLAAYAGVRPSIERPHRYQSVNVEGTLNLLEFCRRRKVNKFIFASSSSVYGGRTQVPFKETDNVMHPISPYAASKVAGEALCHSYHHLFGISMHLMRFFTVYGPRQRPEMAIHLFAKQMLRNVPVKIFGDGRSSRDYTFISDIVEGIAASIEKCKGFEVINLGGSRTTSLNQLVALIGKRLGAQPNIEVAPLQPGDVPITYADITKAKALLNYEPKVDIKTGIDEFCTWLEKHRKDSK